MALQLMATNGPSFLELRRWMARATISLPVPLSPRIRTGAFGRGDFADRSEDPLHLRAGPQQSLKRLGLHPRLEFAEVVLETGDMERPPQ